MLKTILIPLDGSRLAESVLPAAAYLAETLGASITLLHVLEHQAVKEIHGDRHLTDYAEAVDYLAGLARGGIFGKISVSLHVHKEKERHVAHSISRHVEELHPDLILLCKHGRSTMHDFVFGPIAMQVISYDCCPVMILRPTTGRTHKAFRISRILVPLDGNREHAHGLPIAAYLAEACQAVMHLLMIVPKYGDLMGEKAATGRLLPGAAMAVLEMEEEAGRAYLKECASILPVEKLSTIRGEVIRGKPVSTILSAIKDLDTDLVVLGTHGKIGTHAFWSGSLTPRIASKTDTPILLVPVGRK